MGFQSALYRCLNWTSGDVSGSFCLLPICEEATLNPGRKQICSLLFFYSTLPSRIIMAPACGEQRTR